MGRRKTSRRPRRNPEKKAPLAAYTVIERGSNLFWVRIGAATMKPGDVLDVTLDAVPANAWLAVVPAGASGGPYPAATELIGMAHTSLESAAVIGRAYAAATGGLVIELDAIPTNGKLTVRPLAGART